MPCLEDAYELPCRVLVAYQLLHRIDCYKWSSAENPTSGPLSRIACSLSHDARRKGGEIAIGFARCFFCYVWSHIIVREIDSPSWVKSSPGGRLVPVGCETQVLGLEAGAVLGRFRGTSSRRVFLYGLLASRGHCTTYSTEEITFMVRSQARALDQAALDAIPAE